MIDIATTLSNSVTGLFDNLVDIKSEPSASYRSIYKNQITRLLKQITADNYTKEGFYTEARNAIQSKMDEYISQNLDGSKFGEESGLKIALNVLDKVYVQGATGVELDETEIEQITELSNMKAKLQAMLTDDLKDNIRARIEILIQIIDSLISDLAPVEIGDGTDNSDNDYDPTLSHKWTW